jgi:glycerol-3-phosphate dehydrogenase
MFQTPPPPLAALPSRSETLQRLGSEQFDVLIIGGGATGLGTALEAVSRGFK